MKKAALITGFVIVGAILLRRSTLPRGIQNNNPGNIEHGQNWQGQSLIQTDPRFIQFSHPKWGIRAMARILKNYQRLHSINTIQGIISRWAPPTENNTNAYINSVARRTGISPSQHIDVAQNIEPLIYSIIQHENGNQPYSEFTIRQGIELESLK